MRLLPACSLAMGLTLASLAAFASNTGTVREMLMSVTVTSRLGGDTTRPLTTQNAFSFQAPNSARQHQRDFSFGNRLFNTNWVEAPGSVKAFDGLGPLFNRVSCAGCHTKDGRGRPPESGLGPMDSMLLRLSVPGTDSHGEPKPVPGYGDQLSERGIRDVPPEGVVRIEYSDVHGRYGDGEAFVLRKPQVRIESPAYGPLPADLMMSARVAPHMIGLGLLEAVPDATLHALADPEDSDGDGISGTLNRVWDTAAQRMANGRFGWKAGQPDLFNQNAGAAFGDIGLTSQQHAVDNCNAVQTACKAAFVPPEPDIDYRFMSKLTLYTQTLAVPAQRNASDPQVTRGAGIFRDVGCASCHLPSLQTGEAKLRELAQQTFHPYTDLLLHDMGENLADNRPEFLASGREWRTPPLWGLGLVPLVNGHGFLLHDGRARGFAEAILWHGGEAEPAKEGFRLLSRPDREALISFLQSL